MPDTSHSMTTAAGRDVRNADVFITEFSDYSAAAHPVYLVRTNEVMRAIHCIQDHSIQQETDFKVWQRNTGWQVFSNVVEVSKEDQSYRKTEKRIEGTIDPVKALTAMYSEPVAGIYVMYYPHPIIDNPMVHQWINDIAYRAITEIKQRLVLIVPPETEVPAEIAINTHVIDFRAPSHAELRETYDEFLESLEPEFHPPFTDEDIDIFIQNGIGLSAQDFSLALGLAAVRTAQYESSPEGLVLEEDEYESLRNHYKGQILDQKIQSIKQSSMLDLEQATPIEQVGGMDLLKAWLVQRAAGYTDEAQEFGIDIPRGLLAIGPPGTGKSLFAKAVSSVLQVPLIKFDIGRVFGRYVGDSEGRMRAILRQIEDMSPCVVLVDEVDKGFGGMGGGGGDGGTSQRVFGTFLTWLNDRDRKKHPIFVVMTANNVINLPPELFRKGRIDETFAVTFPSEVERMEILRIHLKKRNHELSDADLKIVAKATQNYVGAELESVVSDSLHFAFHSKERKVTADILVQTAKNMKPLFEVFPDKVKAMLEWANNNAKPSSSGQRFELTPEEAARAKPTVPGRTLDVGRRPVPRPKGGKGLDS